MRIVSTEAYVSHCCATMTHATGQGRAPPSSHHSTCILKTIGRHGRSHSKIQLLEDLFKQFGNHISESLRSLRRREHLQEHCTFCRNPGFPRCTNALLTASGCKNLQRQPQVLLLCYGRDGTVPSLGNCGELTPELI